jgi:hypothetical protein
MTRNIKPPASAFVDKSDRKRTHSQVLASVNEPAAQKKKAQPPSSRAKKAERQPRLSRASSKAEKLLCRYCGSDDLSPSFKKRRDARCRACFKKRYGSAGRTKTATRTRKLKATK